MRVLVTGPGGFVGRTLVPLLEARGHEVVRAGRREVGEIGPETPWQLAGIDAVVHLAAQVHDPSAPADRYDRVNRLGTARLADAARAAGVRRFVFVSSAKAGAPDAPLPEHVNQSPLPPEERPGEGAVAAKRQRERQRSPPSPQPSPRGGEGVTPQRKAEPPNDPYGASKLAAEATLAGIPAVILRPPLVHGPGVRANFAALLRLCRSGLPLPLAAVGNQRSFIAVKNLADAVRAALEGTATGTYGVRDIDLSTADLVRSLRGAMGLPARLFLAPPGLLSTLARVVGKEGLAERLLGSLVVDDAAFRRDFSWAPPQDPAEALAETARSVM